MATADAKQHQLVDDAQWFDGLVNMISVKVYYPDEAPNGTWQPPSKNKQKKANAQDKKRKPNKAKFDPANYKTVLDVQRSKALKSSAAESDSEAGEGANASGASQGDASSSSTAAHSNTELNENADMSVQMLKERLQQRINSLSKKRKDNAEEGAPNAKRSRVRGNNNNSSSSSSNNNNAGRLSGAGNSNAEKTAETTSSGSQSAAKGEKKRKRAASEAVEETTETKESGRRARHNGSSEVEENIMFGTFNFASGPIVKQQKAGSKIIKRKKLLSQAQEFKQKLQELQGTDEAEELKKKQGYNAAIQRAKGEKVLDDPTLLKKAIKRDEKKKQKSTEKWKERKKREEEQRAQRQRTRTENIREYRGKKKRPGFEGRKTNFLNK